MMSFALFKATLKKNWLLLFIFFGVLFMYAAVIISMFNPDDIAQLISMLDAVPEDMLKAFGLTTAITNMTTYLASWLYGLLMTSLPMVYSIILANRLVAKAVDNGSMAYLLSTPNSRAKIIITQGLYALLSLAILSAALFGTGVAMCEAMFPGLLDIYAYLKLNVTTMLANIAVMMTAFFFSCLFNETRLSLGFGSGVPIAFLLITMLGNTSDQVKILKDLSIYGWYDPVKVVEGSNVLGLDLVYTGIIAVLFIAGVLIFKRKRLPL